MAIRNWILAVTVSLAAGAASAQPVPEGAQVPATQTRYPDGSPFQAGRPMMTARPVGDKAVIRTIADAMGFIRGVGAGESTDILNRLMWRGKGTMTDARGARYQVKRYTYGVAMQRGAAREDVERVGPDGKADRIVAVVFGDRAWDEREPGLDGKYNDAQAKARRLRLARTPFGFTRALLKADPATVKVVDPGPGGKIVVSLPIEGVATTAALNAQYRPETIAMTVDGQRYEATYPDYADLSEYGVMFPTRIVEAVNGKAALDLAIDDGRVATYVVFPPPETAGGDRASPQTKR
jgi:hypothetical protein